MISGPKGKRGAERDKNLLGRRAFFLAISDFFHLYHKAKLYKGILSHSFLPYNLYERRKNFMVGSPSLTLLVTLFRAKRSSRVSSKGPSPWPTPTKRLFSSLDCLRFGKAKGMIATTSAFRKTSWIWFRLWLRPQANSSSCFASALRSNCPFCRK